MFDGPLFLFPLPAVMIPDSQPLVYDCFIKLDLTHKHAFTPDSFKRYIELIEELEIVRL